MFKIGEFSKLSQVSIRMLRHYDKIDLLVPEKTDKFTGYRYYSAAQLIVINRIQELKKMGFSLNEIKDILKDYKDDDSFKSALKSRKSEIELGIEEMQNQVLLIENFVKRLEEVSIMKYNVNVKEMPERKVASLRKIIGSYPQEEELWNQIRSEIAPQNPKFSNPSYRVAIYRDEEYKETNPDIEIQIAVDGDYKDTQNVKFINVSPMKVASVMMKGGYEQIGEVNATVVNWVQDNNYEFAGDMFSIYHVGPAETKNQDELVTEICFPIKKK
ncbi:MerR family transcriptional regulator [Intestinibacter bartlettii]|uniref:GyrI-like small molecule binding domain protein n=1 Tax=Intestinibacter bartlettii CAG:1329 TaxID=1263063 RepID=R5X543_9FIRM|nr:MerR family transcriptional regulator [Intestinibacter bartlettii]CDA10808.1 gyrI-like small molecule binding domain protein [Intestinibacter bartlettii CAG:1329]